MSVLTFPRPAAPINLPLHHRMDIWKRAHVGFMVPSRTVAVARNMMRRARCESNLMEFALTYFPKQQNQNTFQFHSPSEFHVEFMELLQRLVLSRSPTVLKAARAAPRSFGKSTNVLIAKIWAGAHRHRECCVFLGARGDNAEQRLQTIKSQWLTNPLLAEDFPELVERLKDLHGGDPRRAPADFPWAVDRARLPNRVWYLARGLDTSLPGVLEEGTRPDFIAIDDMETISSVNSATETRLLQERLNSEVLYLHTEGQPASYIYICTIHRRDCISDRITDPQRDPDWGGKRYRGLKKEPARTDLWEEFQARCRAAVPVEPDVEMCARITTALGLSGDDVAAVQPGYRAALAYYVEHKAEMDAGAEVLDPLRLPLHALYQRRAANEHAWRCEVQADPPAQEEEALDRRVWNADFIATHATDYAPLTLPAECPADVLTLGADVHKPIIYYVIRAWAQAGTSWLIEAGVMELTLHAGADEAEFDRARLNALGRLFDVSQQGVQCGRKTLGLRAGFVDEGWETASVRLACQRTGGLWRPCKGLPGMHRPRLQAEEDNKFTLNIGNYHFKHDLARLLERKRGETGFFHLHAQPSHAYLHHMCSESWEPKKHCEGTDVQEYEWRTNNRNNHWWDCEVLACAAAYAAGVRFLPPALPVAPSRPADMGELAGCKSMGWKIGR